MTLREAIDKFVEYRAIRSERSAHSYRIALNHLTRWLDGSITDADELTSQHLREFAVWLANDYRTKYGKKLATVSLELYLVATLQFYGYLLTEGHNSTNFVATREWIKRLTRGRERPPIEKRLPPPEAVKLLLQAADQPPEIPEDAIPSIKQRRRLIWLRNRAVVYCLESSGARVGEIAGLKWGDLVTEDMGAWVIGKWQKERFIRFSPAAWKRLNEYLDAVGGNLHPQSPLFRRHDRGIGNKIAPISTLTIERTINYLASQSGILDTFHLTPHSLRHHFATRFLRHTKNLALTQDVLGHKSPETTRIYAKTSREDHIRAHQEIFD